MSAECAEPDEDSSIIRGFASVFVKVEIKSEPEETFVFTDHGSDRDEDTGVQDGQSGYQSAEEKYSEHMQDDKKYLALQDEPGMYAGHYLGEGAKEEYEDEDDQPLIKMESTAPIKKKAKKSSKHSKKTKCPLCPYKATPAPLKNHMRKHTNEKEFQCNNCPYRTNYQTALLRHQKAKHNTDSDQATKGKKVYIKKYQCTLCEYKTAHNHALKSHMLGKHTAEKPHQCEFCDYRTKYSTALHRHRQMQHKDLLINLAPGEKPPQYKCPNCEYITFYETDFAVHQRKHLSVPYKCNLCRYESTSRDEFLKHIQEHSVKSLSENGGKVAKMGMANIQNISDALLSVIQGMKIEQAEKAPPQKKRKRAYNAIFMCDNCDYHTPYKIALEYHMRKHDSSKPFKCEFCDYCTKYPTSMHRHRTVQHLPKPPPKVKDENSQKVKNHACEICDYRTYYKNNLKAHMRKHSLDKQFKCETCSYESAYRHCFLKHLKSHDEKGVPTTFQCDKCPFHTKHEGRMSWHLLRIHNEVRELNHKCPHCDFSTKTKWRLTVHLQRSRLSVPVKCLSCDFETSFKCENKYHRQTHLPPIEAYEMVPPSTDIAQYLAPNNPVILENQTYPEPIPKLTLQDLVPRLPDPPSENENEIDEGRKEFQTYYQEYEADYEMVQASVEWKKIQVLENKDKEKPFSCITCPYNSRFKAAVQRHWQRMHGGKSRPFKCNHCDFSTTTKDAIALHNRRSKLNYELNCQSCSYQTTFKCAFITHQKIHNAFRCSICTYSCRKKYDLEKHYLMHSGAGFKCRFCDYVTARKHGLMCHETIHTGIKPFKCRYCEYSATRQGQLENHIKRTHVDTKQTDLSKMGDAIQDSSSMQSDLINE